jgi:hypothetical protein
MDGNLAFLLNEMMVIPSVKKGVVTLISSLDEQLLEQVVATQMGITKMYVDEHPEGSDRGGYVPYVEASGEKAFYYEPAESWEGA